MNYEYTSDFCICMLLSGPYEGGTEAGLEDWSSFLTALQCTQGCWGLCYMAESQGPSYKLQVLPQGPGDRHCKQLCTGFPSGSPCHSEGHSARTFQQGSRPAARWNPFPMSVWNTLENNLTAAHLNTSLSSQQREIPRCQNSKEEKARAVRMEGLLGGKQALVLRGWVWCCPRQWHTGVRELGPWKGALPVPGTPEKLHPQTQGGKGRRESLCWKFLACVRAGH